MITIRRNFGDQYNFQFVSYIYYFLTAPAKKNVWTRGHTERKHIKTLFYRLQFPQPFM